MKNKNTLSYHSISKFLITNANKKGRFFGYAGLCLGIFLLLASAQMYININLLIKEKNIRKNGFDFISITKKINEANMMNDNRFTPTEVSELQKQPFLNDAAPLISNQFRAKASAGTIIPFSTDLFLEGIKDDFIDTLPPSFKWEEGEITVPIIFSADYLEMYNVFAPSQDLPQLSDKTINSLSIALECYGPNGMQLFRGTIVAVTNRINSILVPVNFLKWANKEFGETENVAAARVYLKTKDANNPDLLTYLDSKEYHINKDKTKFGRIKQALENIISGLGIFAVIVIVLAMLLFSFYLQLMIEKSRSNLTLLQTLGYSPGWLSNTIAKKWIPIYTIITASAVFICSLLQIIFRTKMNERAEISWFLHPYVFLLSGMILLLSILINYRMIRKLLFRL